MPNGDEDEGDQPQYMFQASGDACGLCSAMNGEVFNDPPSLPHPNCQCQIIPLTADEGCPSYTVEGGTSVRYGSGGRMAHHYAEVTVICCDGTEIGQTIEIDLGVTEERDVEEMVDQVAAAADQAAQEMASGCPEPKAVA